MHKIKIIAKYSICFSLIIGVVIICYGILRIIIWSNQDSEFENALEESFRGDCSVRIVNEYNSMPLEGLLVYFFTYYEPIAPRYTYLEVHVSCINSALYNEYLLSHDRESIDRQYLKSLWDESDIEYSEKCEQVRSFVNEYIQSGQNPKYSNTQNVRLDFLGWTKIT